MTTAPSWFSETLYPDYQQRHLVERVLYEEKTEFQELVIFESPRFGRVLALDGVVQTTERDEFVYHEMLTHVPILAHGAAKRVCIIGGGDGGAMEEALKHPGIETVTLVEIDPKVVELTKQYIPSIPGKAFDDPRAELVIADGREFVKNPPAPYDVIIVDSTDPIGPAQVLFEQDFYADCRDALTDRGIMITQSGVTFMQADEAEGTYKRLERAVPRRDVLRRPGADLRRRVHDARLGLQGQERARHAARDDRDTLRRGRARHALLQPRHPRSLLRAAHLYRAAEELTAPPQFVRIGTGLVARPGSPCASARSSTRQ